MTKAPINLQDLRRSLYVKAKAEPSWRFWGGQDGFERDLLLHLISHITPGESGTAGMPARIGESGPR